MSVAYTEMDRQSRDPSMRVYVSKFLVDHTDGQYSVVLVGNNRARASKLMGETAANDLYGYITSKKRFHLANRSARWKDMPVVMSQKFEGMQSAMFDRYEEGKENQKVEADFSAKKV